MFKNYLLNVNENCFVVWDGDIIYLFYRLGYFLFNEIINIVGMIDICLWYFVNIYILWNVLLIKKINVVK